MSEQIITLYCFFDELLRALNYQDDPQVKLSTAEVMTVALVGAEFFTGNQQKALHFLVSHGYLPAFSASRFNRRLHRVPEALWQLALATLAQVHQQANPHQEHIVDTLPVPVCHNIRIKRCKIYQEEAYRGYCASKKQYYFGLKVCLVTTEAGKPVEVLLAPGSTADVVALRSMELALPQGSTLWADTGFLDLLFEQDLHEFAQINLVVPRRKNMKQQLDRCLEYVCKTKRKQVETTFSLLSNRFARSIHAVTARGFELKVCLSILAFSLFG